MILSEVFVLNCMSTVLTLPRSVLLYVLKHHLGHQFQGHWVALTQGLAIYQGLQPAAVS